MQSATPSLPQPLVGILTFFAFYRTIQAYEKGFASEDTRMLLKPNSEFFQYFGGQSGRPATIQAPN